MHLLFIAHHTISATVALWKCGFPQILHPTATILRRHDEAVECSIRFHSWKLNFEIVAEVKLLWCIQERR